MEVRHVGQALPDSRPVLHGHRASARGRDRRGLLRRARCPDAADAAFLCQRTPGDRPRACRSGEFAVDVARLVAALRHRKLSVFGVQNGTAEQTTQALAAGLIALPSGRDAPVERVERAASRAPAKPDATPKALAPTTRLITEPVRSGQNIIAERGDLVICASVGSGAELVAVGNIHVYGQLRGRALAGVQGDETARIFCQNLRRRASRHRRSLPDERGSGSRHPQAARAGFPSGRKAGRRGAAMNASI